MGSYCIFCHGTSFCSTQYGYCVMFKGLEVDDNLFTFLDVFDFFALDIETIVESFLELFQTKKFFVIVTQLITGVTFGLVAFAFQPSHFFSISIALLAIVAFSGATHDIACDGYI